MQNAIRNAQRSLRVPPRQLWLGTPIRGKFGTKGGIIVVVIVVIVSDARVDVLGRWSIPMVK